MDCVAASSAVNICSADAVIYDVTLRSSPNRFIALKLFQACEYFLAIENFHYPEGFSRAIFESNGTAANTDYDICTDGRSGGSALQDIKRVIWIKAKDSIVAVAILVGNEVVIRVSEIDSVVAFAAGNGIVAGFLANVDKVVAVFTDYGISSSRRDSYCVITSSAVDLVILSCFDSVRN